ncbi:MAG: hypothetical protein GXO91_06755 [FCB group bacterium]|nr:hypothetical protein [FCB group bacterium]
MGAEWKNIITGFLLFLSLAVCRDQVILNLTAGNSIKIYPPVTITNDSIFANTLDVNIVHDNTQLVNIRAEGMDRIILQNSPSSIIGISLSDISSIRVDKQEPNWLTYLIIVSAGAVTGYSIPFGSGEGQLREDENASRVMFAAAGILIGYFIADYIDKKYRRIHQTVIDLTGKSNPEKAELLRAQTY